MRNLEVVLLGTPSAAITTTSFELLVPHMVRPNHVVFIHKHIGHLASRFNPSTITAVLEVAAQHDNVTVHLISDFSKVLLAAKGLDNVHTHWLEEVTPQARASAFSDLYFHLSTNPFEYEKFCFMRWIILDHFISTLRKHVNVTSVMVLDLDVLLMAHPSIFWIPDKPFDFHLVVHGAALMFSPQGLSRFAEYIITKFSNQTDLRAQVAHRKITALSDMWLMNFHLEERPGRSVFKDLNNCHVFDCGGFQGKTVAFRVTEGSVFGRGLETVTHNQSVCIIHFQGARKRLVESTVRYMKTARVGDVIELDLSLED
jgi:hypothetical protein